MLELLFGYISARFGASGRLTPLYPRYQPRNQPSNAV